MLIKNIPGEAASRIKNLMAKSEITMNAYMIQLMKEKIVHFQFGSGIRTCDLLHLQFWK